MPTVRFLVDTEYLRQALYLPSDVTFVDVEFVPFSVLGQIEFTVTSPSAPSVPEGELVRPTFRKQDPVVFVDWGVE